MTADPFLPMAPPLYPRREIHNVGDTPEAERVLSQWVDGRTFHQYALPVWEREDWDRADACEPELKITGELVDGRMRWSYWFRRRSNYLQECGGGSGHSCASDCARAALEGIEEHERAVFESNLVVGVA